MRNEPGDPLGPMAATEKLSTSENSVGEPTPGLRRRDYPD